MSRVVSFAKEKRKCKQHDLLLRKDALDEQRGGSPGPAAYDKSKEFEMTKSKDPQYS